MQFYYAKFLGTPEKYRQVSVYVKPVVLDPNDEDGDIFEPERRFSGAFDTSVKQWYLKNNKNVFKLAFRFILFPKFLKWCKLTHIKKNQFLALPRN